MERARLKPARGRKAALERTQTTRLTPLRGGASAPGNTPGRRS
nr:MAG TPA: hypothetical protein [Caudoviricetes sp.]